MIEVADILILFRLLAAHLIADFLLQPKSWIEQRSRYNIRAKEFYFHIGTVGILTYIFLWDWDHAGLPLFILSTHFLIDWWKSVQKESTWAFLVDQAAHLLMLAVGWFFYADLEATILNNLQALLAVPSFWIILLSYIIVLWPVGYLIGIITKRWQEDLSEGNNGQLTGLQKAGMWIGCTERFIILTFILLNQYSAIGFLIAAKSIFRFSGKLNGNQERKEAEYILIGTLLSFALSIVVGIGTQFLLKIW